MVAVSLKKNFFKQKTASEIGVRLVGSEMCIRDRCGKSLFKRRGGLIVCLNEDCGYERKAERKKKGAAESEEKPEAES